jgi:predicted MFS family arabinose efflux permease
LSTAPHSLGALLALPDFRRLWGIGAGVGVGRWLEMLALVIYVFQITGSPALVAFVSIMRMLPYALLGFVIGSLADYVDRKHLLIGGMVIAVVSAAAMTVLAHLGLASYGVVLIVTGLLGGVWVTDMPVRRRLMVDAVGVERMPAALGFDNSTGYAMRAVGPLLGGIIYQWLGVVGIFALSTAIYTTGLVLALRLAVPSGSERPASERPSLRGLLTPPPELLRNRQFLILLGVTAVYNLWCFPVLGMVPVIAQKDFLLGPAAVGLLSACDGIGGTLGALAVSYTARQATLFRYYYFGTLGFLVGLLGVSLYLAIGTAFVGFLLIGACAACFSATQYGLVYSLSSPQTRGRATGFLSLFISLATIGHFHTGLMFDNFASTTALQIIAIEGLVVMLGLGWLWWRAGR